jgi:hypothetical protein
MAKVIRIVICRRPLLRKLWFIVTCVAALAIPSQASASQLIYQQMGQHDIVTVQGVGSFYAGEIDWLWDSPPAGFGAAVTTYCVDVFRDLVSPQDTVVGTTAEMTTSAQDGGGKVAWLLNTFAPLVSSGVQAAALQVAIWESLYDNDHNLATGTFRIVTDSTAYTGATKAQSIANQATYYLNQLYSLPNGGYYTSTATWLHAVAPSGGQDQITTPEPSSLVLLGLGGLLTKAYRRRRLESAAAA